MSSEDKIICPKFKNDLWLYLSQELPANRCKFWEEHLQSCKNCRVSLQEMKEILEVYDAIPSAEVDENWLNQTIGRAIKPELRKTLVLFVPKYRKAVVTTLALAAAILLFFILPRQHDDSGALSWEDFSVDSFISEIDSTLSSFTFDGDINYVLHLNYEDEDESLDSKIDELQNSLLLLAEDLQNSM